MSRKLPLGVEVSVRVDLERFLPYRVHRLWARTSSPRLATLSSGVSIRAREWRVLMVLAAFGPLTNSEIAQFVSMDTGTTARAIKDLLRLGLVVTRPHRTDRRRQVVTLTAAGAAAHDEIAPRRLEFSDDLLNALSKPEQDQLFSLVDKLEARLEQLMPKSDDRYLDQPWEEAV